MEIFKIIGVGLLTCIIAIIIRQIRPEFYIVVILTGTIVVLFLIIEQLKSVFDYFLIIFNKTNLDYSLLSNMLKIIGVGMLTEFASSVCVDTNNASIGDKIVFAGKIIMLSLSMPIVISLFNMIIEILP